MLPSALVTQLQQGMGDFLRTSFWSSTPAFAGLSENFLDERGALSQGPFVSLKLPFEQGGGGANFFAEADQLHYYSVCGQFDAPLPIGVHVVDSRPGEFPIDDVGKIPTVEIQSVSALGADHKDPE